MTIRSQLLDEETQHVPLEIEVPSVAADQVVDPGMATPSAFRVLDHAARAINARLVPASKA